jgi:hypothetical protein
MEMTSVSIHRRRRGFYVLWILLLLSSLLALVLWETPRSSGVAELSLQLQVRSIPGDTRLRVWAGPWKSWPGASWSGEGAVVDVMTQPGAILAPTIPLSVGYRRWIQDFMYIPRKTADLVVLRFDAPSQAPRYVVLPLKSDWYAGVLRPGRGMKVSIEMTWDGLWLTPETERTSH